MYSSELYNALPSLHAARLSLSNLPGGYEQLLKSLAPLFKEYPQLGICLVHAHCTLAEGEKMISSGRVSQPKTAGDAYPERWLADGTPYEFSSTPTIKGGELPPELQKAFQERLEKYEEATNKSASGLLGIYYVHDPDEPESGSNEIGGQEEVVWLERTEGRMNILEPISRSQAFQNTEAIPAGWFITTKGPLGENGRDDDGFNITVWLGCSCVPSSSGFHSEKHIRPICHHLNCCLVNHLRAEDKNDL